MILFEDKELLVCHKPAGVPVQSARLGQKDMVSILNNYLAEKKERQQVFVVHRLDQPVEGVMVFAKSKKAAGELGKQITGGTMKKTYEAICCMNQEQQKMGHKRVSGEVDSELITGQSYHLVDYLVKNGRTNTSSVVEKNSRDSKRAELIFQVLDKKESYVKVGIDLKTGRHHQIRVQMAHAGLPLYGDQKYHEEWMEYRLSEAQESEMEGLAAEVNGKSYKSGNLLALCSVSLEFRHPVTGKVMKFETSPTSEAFGYFNE